MAKASGTRYPGRVTRQRTIRQMLHPSETRIAGAGPRLLDRLHGLSARRRGWAALGAGALAGLGHVPFSLVPLSILGFALSLALLSTASGWRRAMWTGWLTGLGHFLVTLHWIVEPFLVDIARHGWMAPFGLIFLTGGLALFWALAFGVARWLAPAGRGLPLAWAAALTGAEALRAHLFTGFPWAMPAYVWSETAAIQLAALTGAYGLTLLTLILIAGGTALALRPARLAPAALLIPWLLPVALGLALLRPDPIPADAPVVRLVQPNAPQHQKWDPDFAMEFFQRQLDFSAAPGDPDLIVWSETAIPWLLEPGSAALQSIDAAAVAPVLLGAVRVEGMRAYNSAALLDGAGGVAALYDKHHLVPFGEYVPLGGLTRYLGLPSFGRRDGYGFMPGPGPSLMELPIGTALSLICYEAIFPRDVSGAPARAGVMVQLTNDAWFGTFSGPQQHLAQARFRAVEQGLPLVRVANTGISAVIDPAGRTIGTLPLGQAGWLDLPVPPARAPTLHARTGDLPWLLLPILLLALQFLRRRRELR